MGGSGGGWPSDISPQRAEQYYQETKSDTEQAEFHRVVSEMLDKYLIQFNDRPVESIQRKLDDIKAAIHDDIEEGTVDLKYGGSVQKHTYVDGLSDIDSLVIVNRTELADKNPENIKDYFLSKLKEKLSDVREINKGRLAVTVKFKDGIEIQLLPALKTAQGIRIPSSSDAGWSGVVTPQAFANKLTEVNANLGQKVVPTIKLIKGINAQFPEQRQMSGYHIESLAIEAFKGYQGGSTPKELVKKFFEAARELVKTPIRDKSNQELHVDDYLGKKNSAARKALSAELDFVYRKINNADNACSAKMWEDIFGDV